jgi:hypothetical protein
VGVVEVLTGEKMKSESEVCFDAEKTCSLSVREGEEGRGEVL